MALMGPRLPHEFFNNPEMPPADIGDLGLTI
jgi:hypothetical protein